MTKDQVFVLNSGGQPVWKAVVNGVVIPAEFNTRGAALAAIPVERQRQAKKENQKWLKQNANQSTP